MIDLSLKPDCPSLILVSDELEKLAPPLKEFLLQQSDLYRLLIFSVQDSKENQKLDEIKRLARERKIQFEILNWNEARSISVEKYAEVFRPTARDQYEDSELYQIKLKDARVSDWAARIQNTHFSLLAELGRQGRHAMGTTRSNFVSFKNSLRNIELFLSRPDIRNWARQFTDKPALILGAGPSLSEHLPWIRKHHEKFIVIAADTLISKVDSLGFQPQLFASLERTKDVNHLLAPQYSFPQSYFCGSLWQDPDVFSNFSGPSTLYMPQSAFNSFFAFKRLSIPSGHSCISTAIRLASILGCPQVYLSGVDLCFDDDGKSHSSIAPYTDRSEFSEFVQSSKKLYESAVEVQSNSGEEKKTTYFWNLFRAEFDEIMRQSPSQFFNLSHSGALLKHAAFVSFETAEAQLSKIVGQSSKPKDVFNRLQNLLPYERSNEAREELTRFIPQILELKKESEKIRAFVKQNLEDKNIEAHFATGQFYESVWKPVFQTSFLRLRSSQASSRESEIKEILECLNELPHLLEERAKSLGLFLSSDSRMW